MESRNPSGSVARHDDLVFSCRRSLERLLKDIRSPAALSEVWPQMEAHPLYRETKERWPSSDGTERRRLWDGLCREMERMAYATRPFCLRCGECCRRSSPTLVREDLPLLRWGKISRLDLMTLRRGEIGLSNERQALIRLEEERIKIKEKPGGRECLFYEAGIRGCRIYEDRPLQCRLQACWNPDRYQELAAHRFLTRKDLLNPDDPLWPLIEAHQRHCDIPALEQALTRLKGGCAPAEEEIQEAILFDRKTRRALRQEHGIEPSFQLFLIGRPLQDLLYAYGWRVEERSGRVRLVFRGGKGEALQP